MGVIIPLYNLDLLLKIAGRPGWWLILFLVPIVNFVIIVIVWLNLADFNDPANDYNLNIPRHIDSSEPSPGRSHPNRRMTRSLPLSMSTTARCGWREPMIASVPPTFRAVRTT